MCEISNCKDYDDDIENLQNQITDNANAIAELKKLIGDGNFVKSVVASGNGLVVTMSNGSSTTIENVINGEVKPGSVVEINKETGAITIDGKETGFFAVKNAKGEVKMPYVNAEGELITFDAEGKEVKTGIKKNEVVAVQNTDGSYTLSIPGTDGKLIDIKLPSPASAITSIVIEADEDGGTYNSTTAYGLSAYKFVMADGTRAKWNGSKQLPADKTAIVNGGTLYVRIEPASVDASQLDFSLVNSKSEALENVKFTVAENDKLLTKAANGRYKLTFNAAELSDYAAFKGQFFKADGTANSVLYALEANGTVRSNFFTKVTTPATLATTVSDASYTVKLNGKESSETVLVETNKPVAVTLASGEEFVYDTEITASEDDIKVFGLVFDQAKRTVTVTGDPETFSKEAFTVNVKVLKVDGKIKTIPFTVKTSKQLASQYTYDAVNFTLGTDWTKNNFTIDFTKMKEAMGEQIHYWNKAVNNFATRVYTDAKCETLIDPSSNNIASLCGLAPNWLKADGKTTWSNNSQHNFNELTYLQVNLGKTAHKAELNKTYYVKVSFYADAANKEEELVSTCVIPVKISAPAFSTLFEVKPGTTVDGAIQAFLPNTDAAGSITLKDLFSKTPVTFTSESDLKGIKVSALAGKLEGTDKKYSELFTLTNTASETENDNFDAATLTYNTTVVKNGVHPAYGKDVTIKLTGEKFFGWAYPTTTDAEKANRTYEFKVNLLSPIVESELVLKSDTIVISGAELTAGKKVLTKVGDNVDMYLKQGLANIYNVFADQPGDPSAADLWTGLINKVELSSTEPWINPVITAGNPGVAWGTFELQLTDEAKQQLTKTTMTSFDMKVTDAFGLVKTENIKVQIKVD